MPTSDEISNFCERLDTFLNSPSSDPASLPVILCRDARAMLGSLLSQHTASAEDEYDIGEMVRKDSGDYTFEGVVVAAFEKLSGKRRYVVENSQGILHVFNKAVLKPLNKRIILLKEGDPRENGVHDFIKASRVFDERDPMSDHTSIFDLCYKVHCKTKGVDPETGFSPEWFSDFAPMVFNSVATMKAQMMQSVFDTWAEMAFKNNTLKRQNKALIELADKSWMRTIAHPASQVCKHLIASNIISDMEEIGLKVPKAIAAAVVNADDETALTFDRVTMGGMA